MGYSPWGRKESDTERLATHFQLGPQLSPTAPSLPKVATSTGGIMVSIAVFPGGRHARQVRRVQRKRCGPCVRLLGRHLLAACVSSSCLHSPAQTPSLPLSLTPEWED